MVCILDDIDITMNNVDNEVFRKAALANNSYREGSSIENYSKNLSVYVQVMNIYVDFFKEFWYRDDVDKTNEHMTKELERVGVLGPNIIWTGLTLEEHNSLGEYVLTLDFPINDSAMKNFFDRVRCGELEFLCRYSKNCTNSLELLKDIVYE